MNEENPLSETVSAMEYLFDKHVFNRTKNTTLDRIELTAEQVHKMTAHMKPAKTNAFRYIQRPSRAKPKTEAAPMVCDPKPITRPELVRAARKAVKLVKDGEIPSRALRLCSLNDNYTAAVTQCATNGQLVAMVKAGNCQPEGFPRHCVSFVRWFLDMPNKNGSGRGENDKLREIVRHSGIPIGKLAALAGLHSTTLSNFTSSVTEGLRPETRSRVYAALKHLKK